MAINALKGHVTSTFTKRTEGGNVGAFQAEINEDFIELMGSVKDAVIQLAIDALNGVKIKSPVDTGQFRSNWIVSIGGANEAVEMWSDLQKEAKAGPYLGKDNLKIIQDYSASGDVLAFPSINIQNNLPYALRLEYGHSSQAPLGMVELTLLELAGEWDATTL